MATSATGLRLRFPPLFRLVSSRLVSVPFKQLTRGHSLSPSHIPSGRAINRLTTAKPLSTLVLSSFHLTPNSHVGWPPTLQLYPPCPTNRRQHILRPTGPHGPRVTVALEYVSIDCAIFIIRTDDFTSPADSPPVLLIGTAAATHIPRYRNRFSKVHR